MIESDGTYTDVPNFNPELFRECTEAAEGRNYAIFSRPSFQVHLFFQSSKIPVLWSTLAVALSRTYAVGDQS
jgi:hypothetical protein